MINDLVFKTEKKDRLDKILFLLLKEKELSRSYIQKIIKNNGVTVNDEIVTSSSFIVNSGSEITINMNVIKSDDNEIKRENIELDIIYEDEYLLVINKQNNLVVHPGSGVYSGTLVNALLNYSEKLSDTSGSDRLGIVHRIDKQTTGLLIVAKDNITHNKLSVMFSNREVYKEYHLLTNGVIKENKGVINLPIGRDPKDRKKMAVTSSNSKPAISEFEVIERFSEYTLVKCNIKTGRTHQIRVHFEYIGYPILNDPVYNKKSAVFNEEFGQFLHSYKLKFKHPIKNDILEFIAPYPNIFNDKIKEIREME